MIEVDILKYLKTKLNVPVYFEKPVNMPKKFVLFEKTGSARDNYIYHSTFAFQSYASRLQEAAELSKEVEQTLYGLVELDSVGGVRLNSAYNFTDTSIKKYRYQVVMDISHY